MQSSARASALAATRKKGKAINYDKDPRLAKRLAQRQKGIRKKLRKQREYDEVTFEDGGHIGSQDIAEAGWDLTFDNYDEDYENEKKGG